MLLPYTVQGLSLDKIVVTFDKYFQGGHTYVALSRSKSLEGLYVRNFCKSLTDCDIIGLAETWLHPGCHSENYSLHGFCLIRRDRQDVHNNCKQSECGMCNNKGGVAMYVKSEITFQRQKDMEPDNLECII